MNRPLYCPSLRQTGILAAAALGAFGYALYLRYGVIEQSAIGIACGVNTSGWLCMSRRTAIMLFTVSSFGGVAVGAALLNLFRPSVLLWLIGLIAAGFGVVLYNTGLSALAVALLILSLARAAPEPE